MNNPACGRLQKPIFDIFQVISGRFWKYLVFKKGAWVCPFAGSTTILLGYTSSVYLCTSNESTQCFLEPGSDF
jgi:hypothetical protein